jgi:hypothetical protein
VGAEAPVRAYVVFVDALNLSEGGLVLDEDQGGSPEYVPVSLLKRGV